MAGFYSTILLAQDFAGYSVDQVREPAGIAFHCIKAVLILSPYFVGEEMLDQLACDRTSEKGGPHSAMVIADPLRRLISVNGACGAP